MLWLIGFNEKVFGSVRSSRSHNVRSFVHPFSPSLSRALNLHLLASDLSWWLQDDKCSRAHTIHLSLSGQSKVKLRAVSGLSMLTSSERRSLKYFVLFWQLLRFCSRSHSWSHIQQFSYLIFSARSHVTSELTDFSLDPMANENLVWVPWHHHSMDHQF